MATDRELAPIYRDFCQTYPNQKHVPFEQFVTVLGSLPAEGVRAAAREYLCNGNEFFPTPGQIYQLAHSLDDRAAGRPTPGEAWDLALAEVRRVGYYGEPELPELVARAVDALGGWRYLCHSENLVADRAHYLKIYTQLDDRDRQDRRTHPMVAEHIKKLAAGLATPRLPRSGGEQPE